MTEKTHDKLVKFAKKEKYSSFSDFLVSVGIKEMEGQKKNYKNGRNCQ